MQEEEKQNHSAGTPPERPKKHKKEKGKSLLETMREIDAKEAEKEAEAEERRQALLAERECAINTEPLNIAAIYPHARHPPLNVRAVIDHYVALFGTPPYWQT